MTKSNNADQIPTPVLAQAVSEHLGQKAKDMMVANAILTAIFSKLETVIGKDKAHEITDPALSLTEEAAQVLTLVEVDFLEVANRLDSSVPKHVFN